MGVVPVRGDVLGKGAYGAHRIRRRVTGILLLVDVVEHLERDRALVAHRPDSLEEPRHVEDALARENP